MPDSATQSQHHHVSIVRTFDAPREQVWQAWTEPAQVAEWWGPDEFETPLDSVIIEPYAGGRYHLLMVDTRSGEEFPTHQEIVEISPPELLVLRMEAMPEHGLLEPIVARVELHEQDGGTRLEVSGGPYTGEMGKMAEMGWNQQLDKLVRRLG